MWSFKSSDMQDMDNMVYLYSVAMLFLAVDPMQLSKQISLRYKL